MLLVRRTDGQRRGCLALALSVCVSGEGDGWLSVWQLVVGWLLVVRWLGLFELEKKMTMEVVYGR